MQTAAKSAYDLSGRRKYLTRDECVKFAQIAQQLPVSRRLLCLTLHFTGCRLSEALSLRKEDIDFAESVIQIRCLKKRGKVLVRRIPVPHSLAQQLSSMSELPAEGRLWEYSRTTAWRIVKGVMLDAGISGIHGTAKGLRHGFGVRAAMGKVPVNVIQKWMGHSDSSTTAIYLSVRDEEERELIKRTW